MWDDPRKIFSFVSQCAPPNKNATPPPSGQKNVPGRRTRRVTAPARVLVFPGYLRTTTSRLDSCALLRCWKLFEAIKVNNANFVKRLVDWLALRAKILRKVRSQEDFKIHVSPRKFCLSAFTRSTVYSLWQMKCRPWLEHRAFKRPVQKHSSRE